MAHKLLHEINKVNGVAMAVVGELHRATNQNVRPSYLLRNGSLMVRIQNRETI